MNTKEKEMEKELQKLWDTDKEDFDIPPTKEFTVNAKVISVERGE